MIPTTDVPSEFIDALGVYHSIATWLRRLLVVLGILAIGCSLTATAFTGEGKGENDKIRLKILSCVASASVIVLTSFNIAGKGNNARNAYRHLLYAVELFRYGLLSIEGLVKAHKEAEIILGSVDFTYILPNSIKPTKAEDAKSDNKQRADDAKPNDKPAKAGEIKLSDKDKANEFKPSDNLAKVDAPKADGRTLVLTINWTGNFFKFYPRTEVK